MIAHASLLTLFALACAAIAGALLVGYLIVRPPLDGATKLWLLAGLGVFPWALPWPEISPDSSVQKSVLSAVPVM